MQEQLSLFEAENELKTQDKSVACDKKASGWSMPCDNLKEVREALERGLAK